MTGMHGLGKTIPKMMQKIKCIYSLTQNYSLAILQMVFVDPVKPPKSSTTVRPVMPPKGINKTSWGDNNWFQISCGLCLFLSHTQDRTLLCVLIESITHLWLPTFPHHTCHHWYTYCRSCKNNLSKFWQYKLYRWCICIKLKCR